MNVIGYMQCGPDCPGCVEEASCECSRCATPSLAPCCIRVTFSGFSDSGVSCPCPYCSLFNTTVDVPIQADTCEWIGPLCTSEQPNDVCGAATVRIRLIKPASNYLLFVEIRDAAKTTTYFQFRKDFGTSSPDCDTWSSYSIPYNSQPTTLPAAWGQCSLSGLTCTITALTDSPTVCAAATEDCEVLPATVGCGRCHVQTDTFLVTIPASFGSCNGCTGELVLTRGPVTSCTWEYFYGDECQYDMASIFISDAGGGFMSVLFRIETVTVATAWKALVPYECTSANRIDCTFGRAPFDLEYCGQGPSGLICGWDGDPNINTACTSAYDPVTIQAI